MSSKYCHLSDNRGLYGGAPSGNKRTTNQNAPFQISNNQNELQILPFLRIEMPPYTTRADFLEGQVAYSHTRLSNNRSVMPLDVRGRTRATLKESACVRPGPEGSGNPLNLLRARDWGL